MKQQRYDAAVWKMFEVKMNRVSSVKWKWIESIERSEDESSQFIELQRNRRRASETDRQTKISYIKCSLCPMVLFFVGSVWVNVIHLIHIALFLIAHICNNIDCVGQKHTKLADTSRLISFNIDYIEFGSCWSLKKLYQFNAIRVDWKTHSIRRISNIDRVWEE